MVFKNIKTGNLLSTNNKDVISMMNNQPAIYAPVTAPAKSADVKPDDTAPAKSADIKPDDTDTKAEKRPAKGKTK